MSINKYYLGLIESILDPLYDGSMPTPEQFNEVMNKLGAYSPKDIPTSFWADALCKTIERDYHAHIRFINNIWSIEF